MKRAIRGIVLALVGIVAVGCVAAGPPAATMVGDIPWPPPDYQHTVGTVAIRQYWNCTRPEPGLVRLDGLVANISGQPVKFLAWELAGVDAGGNALTSEKVEAAAIVLQTNEYTKFQIVLRPTGNEARFDLYYEYQFQDTGHGPPFAALDWDGPVLMAWTNRFFVRDACSATQHLAR